MVCSTETLKSPTGQINRMKKAILLFIFYSTIWSCSNPSVDNSNIFDTSIVNNRNLNVGDTNKIQNSNISNSLEMISFIDTATSLEVSTIKTKSNFPFGCSDLNKYKYPKHWKGHEEGLVQPKGKEFEEIGQCFQKINSAKAIGSPKVNKLEVLKIGNYNKDYSFDSLALKSIDSCIYHLPNIGIYECYYFSHVTKIKTHGIYGNLLLLDPITSNGKLLNIYFEYSGDQHINLRYFMIYSNGINLYEGACYDDGCSLTESYRITIKPNGEINIKEIKI